MKSIIKHLLLLFGIMIIINCTGNIDKNQKHYFFKDNIAFVVDSFISQNSNYNYFEMYINKEDPHTTTIIFYAGKESYTQEENDDYKQESLIQIEYNNKNINIFSGAERYISLKGQKLNKKQRLDYSKMVFWVIKDSFNIITIDKSRSEVYPFMPLPLKVNIDFVAPIIEEEDNVY